MDTGAERLLESGGQRMDIFELRRNALADYRDFVRSFILIASEHGCSM
ncbi:MAG: hypothetical protein N3C12_05610 [Candidatus Binatia bacterium]|nr:hypothetical protein [Candidatus Binatia bacterium]